MLSPSDIIKHVRLWVLVQDGRLPRQGVEGEQDAAAGTGPSSPTAHGLLLAFFWGGSRVMTPVWDVHKGWMASGVRRMLSVQV